MNEVWHARRGIVPRGCARGRSGPDGENLAAGVWQRLEALPDPRSPQGQIYPLACLIAIAVCASPPPGMSGSLRSGSGSGGPARPTWPSFALRGIRSGASTGRRIEKTIQVVLDRLGPRALARALLGHARAKPRRPRPASRLPRPARRAAGGRASPREETGSGHGWQDLPRRAPR